MVFLPRTWLDKFHFFHVGILVGKLRSWPLRFGLCLKTDAAQKQGLPRTKDAFMIALSPSSTASSLHWYNHKTHTHTDWKCKCCGAYLCFCFVETNIDEVHLLQRSLLIPLTLGLLHIGGVPVAPPLLADLHESYSLRVAWPPSWVTDLWNPGNFGGVFQDLPHPLETHLIRCKVWMSGP